MSKKKRIISLLTPTLSAIILLLFLSACQGAVESDVVEEFPIQSTTAVPQAEPVEAEAVEPDIEAEPIQVESVEPVTKADPVEAEPVDAESLEKDSEADPIEAEPVDAESVEKDSEADPIEAEPVQAEPEEQRTWVTRDFSVAAADGLEIAGMATLPESGDPVPAVLLLHMLGSNQQAWLESDLLTMLNDQGYATFTVDMRGHGATGGTNDWNLAQTDLQVVWQYLRDLPEVDGQATAVIGASIGANMALRLTANVPQIDTAVLLSPGLEYRGVTTEDALADYGERPLFYAVSEGDSYAAGSVNALFNQTPGLDQVEIFTGSAHGTQMLTAEPGLTDLIVSWLDQHVE